MHIYILSEKTRFYELTNLLLEKGFDAERYEPQCTVAMFVDFDLKKIKYTSSVTCAACYCSGRFNSIKAGFIIDNFDEIVNKENYALLDEIYFRKTTH